MYDGESPTPRARRLEFNFEKDNSRKFLIRIATDKAIAKQIPIRSDSGVSKFITIEINDVTAPWPIREVRSKNSTSRASRKSIADHGIEVSDHQGELPLVSRKTLIASL
jgi:hypothetical protein